MGIIYEHSTFVTSAIKGRSPEMVADGCVLLLESTRAVLVHGIGNTTPVDTLRYMEEPERSPQNPGDNRQGGVT